MPTNEKRRYVMMSDLRQYIAEYTVANFWRYPIRRRVTYASALELVFYAFSTLFKSYWDDGRTMMKGYEQQSAVRSRADFRLQWGSALDLVVRSWSANQ